MFRITKIIITFLILSKTAFGENRDLTIYYNDAEQHGQAIFKQLRFDFDEVISKIDFNKEEIAPLIFFLQDLQEKQKYINDRFNLKFKGSSDFLKIRFGNDDVKYLNLIPENLEFDGYINYVYLLCREFRYDYDLEKWEEVRKKIDLKYKKMLYSEVVEFLNSRDDLDYVGFYEFFGGWIDYSDVDTQPVLYKDGNSYTLSDVGFIPKSKKLKIRPRPDYSYIVFYEPQRIGYFYIP